MNLRNAPSRTLELLCLLLFLLPVFLIPLVFTSFNTDTIVMKETILLFSAAYLLCGLPLFFLNETRSASRSKGSFPIGIVAVLTLLLLYLACSYWFVSPHPRSAHELARWLACITLAIATMMAAEQKRFFRLYLLITLVTSFIVSGYALVQAGGYDFFNWGEFAWGMGVSRVCASLGNPDFLAGYLVALLPLTLTAALIREGGMRRLLLCLFFVQCAAMIFSYSRGGWVAAFVTFLILFASVTYVNWIRDPVLLKPVISLRTSILLLVFMLIVGVSALALLWEEVTAAFYRLAQLGEGSSFVERPFFYRAALAMIAEKPLFGFGIGTFAIQFPQFRSDELSTYLPFKEFYVDHAHNEYLEIAAETGLVGLFFYLLVIALVTLKIWKTVMQCRSRENLILIGLWCGMVGILIHNLFTVTLRHTPTAFLLWSILGLAAGYAESQRFSGGKQLGRIRKVCLVVLPLFAPLLVIPATCNYVGDYLIRVGCNELAQVQSQQTIVFNRERLQDALVVLHKGERLAPDRVQSHFWMGLAYYNAMDYQQAQEAYQNLDHLQKDFTSTALNVGISYLKQAGLLGNQGYLPAVVDVFPTLTHNCIRKAIPWFQRCILQDPTLPDHYFLLGQSYFWLGQLEQARQSMTRAIELSQKRPFQTEHLSVEKAKELIRQIEVQNQADAMTLSRIQAKDYTPFDKRH
ncbi:MAG: hypothetical protein C4527_06560 [Candidatus Omnitrophota bacterium]|nr:MAG: hypothetical protein C4527_06560 [Candidatus Omnitrophota bacterium]